MKTTFLRFKKKFRKLKIKIPQISVSCEKDFFLNLNWGKEPKKTEIIKNLLSKFILDFEVNTGTECVTVLNNWRI